MCARGLCTPFPPLFAHHLRPDELLRVVKASLQKLGQVIVLGGADKPGDGQAGERTGPRVQVGQQEAKRLAVELDDGELRLGQARRVHLLAVRAEAQFGHRQLGDVVRLFFMA